MLCAYLNRDPARVRCNLAKEVLCNLCNNRQRVFSTTARLSGVPALVVLALVVPAFNVLDSVVLDLVVPALLLATTLSSWEDSSSIELSS